jgi:stalled ribosome alternative rescue factor ArfA
MKGVGRGIKERKGKGERVRETKLDEKRFDKVGSKTSEIGR